MAIDEKYKLSTYEEISVLLENSSKKICIVKNEVSDKLYVKKVLSGTDYFNFYVRFTSLKHKNLIEIHDVICLDGATHVFEEYINGQTLQALLENEGVQSESKAVEYILQVCDALIYLHSQDPPIIHRDIKPENIMLSADNVIKLVDFDIAREFKQSAKRDTIFMGTKEYAAPEQYGFKQTDGRTDIYALGVLLHEMLTGKLPQNNITYKGDLRKIIVKCLRLEPEQRYQSVSALKKALVNTRVNRHKKMGLCALSAIATIGAMLVFFPKISGSLYNTGDFPSDSVQPVTEQNSDDFDLDIPDSDAPSSTQPAAEQNPNDSDNPDSDAPPSEQPVTEQNPDGLDSPDLDAPPSVQPLAERNPDDINNPDPDAQFSSRTILGQKFDDVADLFVKVHEYEEKPTIILEQEALNKIIRDITRASYDSAARAFQEYDDSYTKVSYDPDFNLFVMATCNFENGVKHDRLLFEVSGEYMNITYYDPDLETTFYFTTNDDKGLLSGDAFNWIKHYPAMFETPVVFNEAPIADITGIYYVGNKTKIEIFEESGEMMFSYTDIRSSKEAEPWVTAALQKLDDNHYWIKTFTGHDYKEMLIFNFSQNHLTLFNMLKDSGRELVYDIAGRGVTTAIDPRGIYNKA